MSRHAALAALLLAGLASATLAQPLGRPAAPPPDVDLSKLPPEAIIRLGSTHFYQGGTTTAAAFSPDSSSVATCANDGSVALWDVATGQERAKWRHIGNNNIQAQVMSVQFAPGGRMLATSGNEGSVHVWDTAGRSLFMRPSQRFEPIQFAWMPGDRIAFVTRAGAISVHDVGSGKEITTWATRAVGPTNLACSPDGKHLIVRGQDGKLTSFDPATGKEDVTYADQNPGPRYYRNNHPLAFLPDGRSLFAGGMDQTFAIWDSTTGKMIRRIDSVGYANAAALSPNGRFLAVSGTDARIRLVGLASGAELRSFETARVGGNVLTFAPNGRWLAAAVGGQGLRIWDVNSGDELHRSAGHRAPIQALAFLADGRLVTAGQDQSLRCWDVKTGEEIDRYSQQMYTYQMAPSPDGKSVLLPAGQYIYRWEPGGDHSVWTALGGFTGANSAIAPDGRTVATHNGQQIGVVELPGGKEMKQIATPTGYPQALALSPGKRYLAYVENNNYGVVHVWDVQYGVARKPIVGDPGQQLFAERMLFSPDGRLLVSVYNQRPTYVWEAFTGLLRVALPRADTAGTASAAFSPDGRLLALGGNNGALDLYDLRTGDKAGPFLAHRGAISGLAFSADGTRLGTASQDCTAVVWDAAKLRAKLNVKESASAPTAAQLDAWWSGLAAADGRAASEAIWSLSAAPKSALALFRDKLKPIPGVDRAKLDRWVADLDHPRFAVREDATRHLASQGESARDALTAGGQTATTPEGRSRIRRLLEVINSHFAPNRLQPLRALEVLEKIGGAEAREQLEALAKLSTDEEIRQEVKRVLERWRGPAGGR